MEMHAVHVSIIADIRFCWRPMYYSKQISSSGILHFIWAACPEISGS